MVFKRWLTSSVDAIEDWEAKFAPFDRHPSLRISD